MIIGISGKAQSGKDTVANIIQYLFYCEQHKHNKDFHYPVHEWLKELNENKLKEYPLITNWEIRRFADAVKDIICILTGCTRRQLEDIDFKNSKLPDEWIRYGYADGFIKKYIGNGDMGEPIMNDRQCSKERYEEELRINWQTAYKSHLTYRELLQVVGTNLFRNQLHEDVWINALMSKYKCNCNICKYNRPVKCNNLPNWIIPDVRFPNEVNAIVKRGGVVIRIVRPDVPLLNHESETALDHIAFDNIVVNEGSIEDLVININNILLKLKLI